MIRRQSTRKKFLNAKPIVGRLRKIRRYFGYSQQKMADILGIVKETYGKNERGYHLLQLESLVEIHEKLGVSVEWLLFNREPVFWKADKKIKGIELKGAKQGDVLVSTELEEMIDLLTRIPLLRYAVLGYYQKLKLENQQLIGEILEKEEKAKTPG